MENPELFLSLICLAVAIYMFAALKFRALLFIFRLKGGVAKVVGVDDDANQRFGIIVGLFAAPVIGLIALFAAGYFAVEWNSGRERLAKYEADIAASKENAITEIREAMRLDKATSIYRGSESHGPEKLGPSDADEQKIVSFFRSVEEIIDDLDIDTDVHRGIAGKVRWSVRTKCQSGNFARFDLYTDLGVIMVLSSARDAFPSARGFIRISIPESKLEEFRAIGLMAAVKGSDL